MIEIANERILLNNRELPHPDNGNINVDRIDDFITYDSFFSKYLMANRPCIINSRITDVWPCKKLWVSNDAPNFDALKRFYGETVVPIADCNKRYYNSQFKDDMIMKDYLNYWQEFKAADYTSMMPLFYLKDWHCVKNFPDNLIYQVPSYFASDWLNEYYIGHPKLNDDYMFVYMGPKGTWTPLHADVFTSYSWSANIVGRKRWLLFPPHEEEYLRDLHGQLAYDATSEELLDRTKYNKYDYQNLKCINVIQEPGEVMFAPSGWHHQVWNLDDTISINHNWINSCNILNVWLGLKKGLQDIMKEIEDCKEMGDWIEHCQLMLKTSHGMDYKQFWDIISYIAQKRANYITTNVQVINFEYKLGTNHCLYDLEALNNVLKDFIKDAKDKQVYSLVYKNDEPSILFDKINTIITTKKKEILSVNT